jgi:hypothetical protein
MPRDSVIVAKKASSSGSGTAQDKATFGLVRPLEVENRLTLYYICRKAGTFTDVTAKVSEQPPGGQDAYLDIKISKDDGANWDSIFPTGTVNKLKIAKDNWGLVKQWVFDPSHNTIDMEDILRIDCLQTGSTVPGKGIEVVLRWE